MSIVLSETELDQVVAGGGPTSGGTSSSGGGGIKRTVIAGRGEWPPDGTAAFSDWPPPPSRQ